ncbi:MAG: TerC family protein [Chloroflexi bacterium]|nr:TerC family protein [Chloroflexota bacterium]
MDVFPWLQAVLAIVLIDLTLAGDNALVIGLAARALPARQRRLAIIIGGAGAVGFRIAMTAAVTLLLQLPYLQGIGAVALVVIAYRLVRPGAHSGGQEHASGVREGMGMREAIATILVADIVMSLDNVLAVGAAAHGDIGLLAFGLGLSIPIVLFGASFVARLTGRFPWIIWLGAFALTWTAAKMFTHEPALKGALGGVPAAEATLTVVLTAIVVLAWMWAQRREPTPARH